MPYETATTTPPADLASRAIDGVLPYSIAKPANEDELRDAVASANADGTAVFPWGGGTRMALGNVPARRGVVIETSRLNRVASHNAADMTATFQAGATMRFVSETLARAGQLLAIDAPIPGSATVGGTLAAGLSGHTKWQFGHLRDTVIGMKVVQPDGAVTKSGGQVVKNVSGYDMSRLHIGGLGGLGVILEASFKLTPIPMYESTLVARFDDLQDAMNCSLEVFNSYVTPLAISAFDSGVADGVGMDDRAGTYVAFRLGGRPRTLDRQVDEVGGACARNGAAAVEQTTGGGVERLWRALSDYGWGNDSNVALSLRATTMPSEVGEVHRLIERVADGADGRYGVDLLSQPGFGTVESFWRLRDADGDSGAGGLVEIVNAVRAGADRIGAAVIVQSCPAEVKREFDVWGAEPRGMGVMRRLKAQYDPNGIMNPGRLAGGM